MVDQRGEGEWMSFDLGIVSSDAECGSSGCPPDSTGEEGPRQRSARATQRITALGEMTRGISHDFRNILAIVDSGLRLAEDNLQDPEKARSYLAAAHEGLERGMRLTSQLLAFAKPQALDIHPEDANELIRKLALFLKYGAGPGIRIRFDLASEIPICLIGPTQFNAAILNLVVNARDAMPDGGEITISTSPCRIESALPATQEGNTYLVVRVADTGQGMSPETLKGIFDPYFTTKGNTGTGLGVPQVHAFMQRVGGEVRVTSEPGAGTCFDLLFPALDNAGPGPDNLWRQLDRWINEGGASDKLDVPRARDEAPGRRRPRETRRELQ